MSHRMTLAVAAAALALVATSGFAHADRTGRRVFLNGVELTDVDVGEREFSGAKVRFDADGNVHIQVDGLQIGTRELAPARGPATVSRAAQPVGKRPASPRPIVAGSLTGRFFVANRGAESGRVQYDVAVYVNKRLVKTVRAGERDGVVEITKYVRTGKNRVRIVATKNLGKAGKRRSYSPTDEMEVSIGEGSVDKGVVTIRRTVASLERTAADSGASEERVVFIVER